MNSNLTQKLVDKYPKLFSKIKRIYCPDGWYNLLDVTCQLLQGYAIRNAHDPSAQVAFTNINIHMGELRLFYVGGRMHDYLDGVKDNAQRLSATICEETGKPGTKHRALDGAIYTVSSQVAELYRMTALTPTIVVERTKPSPGDTNAVNAALSEQ